MPPSQEASLRLVQRFEPNKATDYMSMNVRALRVDVLFMWVLVCLDRSRASCVCANAFHELHGILRVQFAKVYYAQVT